MDASDWIAIVAAAIALGSVGLTLREQHNRKKEVEAEREDRGKQLDLLQRQVEADLEERQRQRRSHLFATAGRVEGGVNGGRVDRHFFTVTNSGPDPADALRFGAVAESGTTIVEHTVSVVPVLMPGAPQEISLDIPMGRSREGGLKLRAWWRDGSGDREEDLMPIQRHG